MCYHSSININTKYELSNEGAIKISRQIKIAFIASSGGHLEEIERLKKVEKKYDSFLITEAGEFSKTNFCRKKYLVSQMNRRQLVFLPKLAILFIRAIGILIKEKPDFIITTGALVAYPFCVVGKLMGVKIVYVESFARVLYTAPPF